MFRLLVLILVCSFGPVDIRAQGRAGQHKIIFWFIDLGTDTHIGQENLKIVRGVLYPNWGVYFYDKKNYSNPGCRLRISAMLYNARNTYFGIQSGITFHRESKGSLPYNLISVPVQLRVLRKIDDLGNNSLFMDIAGGLNIFKAVTESSTIKEETGPLFTAGILFKLKNKIFIRGGYEYQIDNVSSSFWGDPSNPSTKETLRNKQKRENIYLSMGFIF
jgi:hypothetical protein